MDKLDFSGLTCVIPTHHREPFLRRQLQYIAGTESFPQTMIVDSSLGQAALANQHLVTQFSDQTIDYVHDPSPFFEKLTRALERVSTPFVVICADDDTFAPQGLATCLSEIKADDACAAVMGRCYILNTSTKKLSIARGYSLQQQDPVQRLRFYLNNWFSNYYAIHRRDRLIEQLQLGQMVVDPQRSRLLNEVLDSMLVLCAGPLKYIDVDYLMYQIHGENLSKNSVAIANPSECDYLTQAVSNALASYLARRQGLRPGEATPNKYPFSMTPGDAVVELMLAADIQHFPVTAKMQIDRLLRSYMTAQRIPGRGRSRFRRVIRQFQKAWREGVGIRANDGFLEKQELRFSEDRLRDATMQQGLELSIAYPAGVPNSSVALGKTA